MELTGIKDGWLTSSCEFFVHKLHLHIMSNTFLCDLVCSIAWLQVHSADNVTYSKDRE